MKALYCDNVCRNSVALMLTGVSGLGIPDIFLFIIYLWYCVGADVRALDKQYYRTGVAN